MQSERKTDSDIKEEYSKKGFIPFRVMLRNGKLLSHEDSIYFTEKEISEVFDIFGSIEETYQISGMKFEFDEDIVEIVSSVERPEQEMVYIKLDLSKYITK